MKTNKFFDTVINVFSWSFGIMIIISALAAFTSSFITGLAFLLMGLILLPPSYKAIASRAKKEITPVSKGLFIFIMFIIVIAAMPTPAVVEEVAVESSTETVAESSPDTETTITETSEVKTINTVVESKPVVTEKPALATKTPTTSTQQVTTKSAPIQPKDEEPKPVVSAPAPVTTTPAPASNGYVFYVSSKAKTKYYCSTDSAWQGLEQSNLLKYNSEAELKADYPSLVLNKPC